MKYIYYINMRLALFVSALLWLTGCAVKGEPPLLRLQSGPQGGSAITSSPLEYHLESTGYRSCGWKAANAVGAEVSSGTCSPQRSNVFDCRVSLPAPGRYTVTFTAVAGASAAQVVVADLDYRPRYGGAYPEMDDPTAAIAEGWGAWGGSPVADPETWDFIKDNAKKGEITLYRPVVVPAPRPAVFFISGWGREAATYEQLFRFIASKGFVVVDVYNEDPGDINNTYPNALAMIREAVARYPGWFDTTRVGIMGHSLGGGMAFWMAVKLFAGEGWGANGRFIFTSAPWYTFLTRAADLASVPADTKVLLQAYEEDLHTDPEIYQLVYRLLPTPDAEKDFVYVRSGSAGERDYHANHFVSYTGATTQWDPVHYEPYDRLDSYAINRLLDALMAYAFDGDLEAKAVALGGGAAEQVDMGPLPPLEVSDDPDHHNAEVDYTYVCKDDNDEGWDDVVCEGGTHCWLLQDSCR